MLMANSEKQTENQEAETNWQYTSDNQDKFSGSEIESATPPANPTQLKPVSWEASEYIVHEKSAGWYVGLGIGTALLTLGVYLISNQEILPPLVILVACISIGVYAGRKPATKHYSIDSKGIHVESEFHSFGDFRSFSVVEEGAVDSVWLTPLKRFAPMVVMYFSPDDESKIISVLANFLPHEQKELDAIDRFTRRMKY